MTFTKILRLVRLSGAFTLLAFVATLVYGQGNGYNAQRSFSTTFVQSDIALSEQSSILYHQVAWITTGTPATCTVSIDSSSNGVTWTTGGIIAGQTCTSTGNSTVTAASAAFVRINVTAFSGGTSPVVSVNYTGWSYNPAGGGGGSGTVSSCASSGVAFYSGTGTVVGCDTNFIDNGSGGLTIPTGSASSGLSFSGNSVTLWSPTSNTIGVGSNTQSAVAFNGNTGAIGSVASTGLIGFTSSTLSGSGAQDTSISRDGTAVFDFGNGTAANTNARLRASAYISVGATFTSSGGCAETTLVGGGSAGKFTSGTTGSCATTITMGNAAHAVNGWSCSVSDQTTGVSGATTGGSTTTASITVATTSGNIVSFSCIGF